MRKFLNITTVFFSIVFNLYGNGKISGTVVDKITKDPLPGANVILEGTILGVATNLDGYFEILNIPTGDYNVSISMIGYKNILINDIKVEDTLTTIVNAELEVEPLDTYTWEHRHVPPIFRLSTSKKIYILSEDDLYYFPGPYYPISFASYFPGMNTDIFEAAVNIRGGNLYSNQIFINGIPIYQYNGFYSQSYVSMNSLREINLIPGGFEAEYGNSTSGITNMMMNRGISKYIGNISLNYDIDSIDEPFNSAANDLLLDAFISGPITKNISFSLSHINQNAAIPVNQNRESHRENFSCLNFIFSPTDAFKIETYTDYNETHSKRLIDQNISSSLMYLSPTNTLEVKTHNDQNSIILLPFDQYSNRFGLKAYYILSPRSFTELYIQRQYNKQHFKFSNFVMDTTLNFREDDVSLAGIEDKEARTWTTKYNFISQLNKNNMIKTGIEYISHDFNFNNTSLDIDEINYSLNPSLVSVYAQDRYEAYRFTVNAGLRYDYFTQSSNIPEFENATQWKLSPRIGLVVPFNFTSKIFINSGIYYQIPNCITLAWYDSLQSQKYSSIYLINLNTEPEETKMFELGYEQLLDYKWVIYSSVYYKDMKFPQGQLLPSKYKTMQNSKRDILGVEIGVTKVYENYIKGSLFYSYMNIRDEYLNYEKNMISNKWSKSTFSNDFSINSDRKWGLTIWGFHPLYEITFSMLNQFHFKDKSLFNLNYNDYWICSLKINKELRVYPYHLNVFMEIQNLFDYNITIKTENNTYYLYNRNIEIGFRFKF